MQPLPKMPIGEGSAGKGTSPEGGAIVVRTSIREGRLTDAGPLGPIDPLQNVRRLGLAPILTSEGLGWRGIKAERFRHSLREIEQPPFQNHLITHMAELVRFERRGGGRVDKGYHAPGNVGLIPAGGPAARWILEGEADGLQLSLDPAIVEGSPRRFIEAPGMAIGYADKAIEIALVALLLADAYRARSEPSGEVSGARTTGA